MSYWGPQYYHMTPYDPDGYGYDDLYYEHDSYERHSPIHGFDRYDDRRGRGYDPRYDDMYDPYDYEDRYGRRSIDNRYDDEYGRRDYGRRDYGRDDKRRYDDLSRPPSEPPRKDGKDVPKRGRLQVRVTQGRGLPNSEEAFVRLRFPEKVERKKDGPVFYTSVETNSLKNSGTVDWNESFDMHPICHPEGGSYVCLMPLEIEVVGHDKGGKREVLGSGKIDLRDLERDMLHRETIRCNQGELFVELKCMDFGQSGMKVTVVSASDCKGDIIGAPEVYVILRYRDQQHRTKTVKDKNPNFSQAFNFKTENRPSGGMVVATGLLEWEVWDKDSIGKDDKLGSGTIDLERLDHGRPTTKEVALDKKGKLTLEITPIDFGQGKKAAHSGAGKPSQPPPPGSRIDEFPLYRGPYREEPLPYESQYSAFPVEGDHSQKARVMHQKFDAFPSYQGDHVPERTKSYKFRPTSGGDHGTDPFYGLQGNKQSFSTGSSGKFGAGSGSSGAQRGHDHPDIGTLHITVVRANLKEPVDAAVRLKIEDKKIETSGVKKQQTTPFWNESFKFFIRLKPGGQPGTRIGRTATMPLQAAVIDKATNEEVGSAIIPLQDLYEGKGTEIHAAQLKNKSGSGAGSIDLTLKPLGCGLKAYTGKLRVRVLRATNLKKGDMLSQSDGYVVLKLNDEKYQTKTIKNDKDPDWDEEFMFSPDVFERKGFVTCTQELHVEVFDKDKLDKDDSLGSGSLDLSQLYQGKAKDFTVDLDKDGKLYLRVEAENFGQMTPEEIKEYQEKNARKPASPVNPSSSHKPNFPDYGKHSQSSSGLTDSGYGRSGHQDADDATIGALKDELHRLQMQSLDLERKNSTDVVPLQMELNVVRAQLDRANVQRQRLQSPDGRMDMDTFGTPQRRKSDGSPHKRRSMTAMERLDAADGKMDGKYYGKDVGTRRRTKSPATPDRRHSAKPSGKGPRPVSKPYTVESPSKHARHPPRARAPPRADVPEFAYGEARGHAEDVVHTRPHGPVPAYHPYDPHYSYEPRSPVRVPEPVAYVPETVTYTSGPPRVAGTRVAGSYFVDPQTGRQVSSLQEISALAGPVSGGTTYYDPQTGMEMSEAQFRAQWGSAAATPGGYTTTATKKATGRKKGTTSRATTNTNLYNRASNANRAKRL